MRLLCDQNVDHQYVDALVAATDFTVLTVRAALDPRATDTAIAAYAAANDYVVFTSDDDFFRVDHACGRCYYVQADAPPVGDVLAAGSGYTTDSPPGRDCSIASTGSSSVTTSRT